jgi:dephospho-CoA kinase
MIMLRIGITGGFGSGKSTAAAYYGKKQYPVIYADPLAKKLMVKDKAICKKLTDLLGTKAYLPDTSLNKEYVAQIIFSEPEKKREVERIVHPAVLDSIEKSFSKLLKKHPPTLAFVEAALIFESHMEDMLDFVVVVTAPVEDRIRRIAKRDKTDEDEIRKRIAAQRSDEYLISRADFVIQNNGDIRRLHQRCAFLEKLFLSMEQGS